MNIPDDKRYFRIGEASRIIGVKPYVLRYWETEFPGIRPKRANSQHRVYKWEDIEILKTIKKLLYEDKLTIEGARRKLKPGEKDNTQAQNTFLFEIKKDLLQVLKILR